MKAIVNQGDKTVAVQEVPVPKAGAGEILVKVHYAAQNPTDWKQTDTAKKGYLVGCDFAGTVADANGSHWREGQRVAGFIRGNYGDPIRGAFAEYTTVEASLVFAIPEKTSYADAAVVSLAYATAVQALFQRLKLPEPSEPTKSAFPVFINGGSSSVGMYAIQLAKLAGLFVVTTGSKRNHELLKSLGADAVIDYNDSNWVEQVRQVTNDKLEHVLDCISEKEPFNDVARTLSPSNGGHIVAILPREQEDIDPTLTKVKVESTIAYTVFERPFKMSNFHNCGTPTPEDKAVWEKYLGTLSEYLEQGKIKPNPTRELGGIDDIVDGFKLHKEGKVRAEKIVYKIA